ncbi:hypothetical protein EWM64_g4960 [Hericium alpestre]|uniref:Enoyl reductase (ER) domain-containing protein n=1 Tax=Hericium alpestre TaxID=135208 RepID=A0A4Y9ZZU3_9AGAM|nr:hypothetical protein EWM64_g4960 [Hericium alpestre]
MRRSQKFYKPAFFGTLCGTHEAERMRVWFDADARLSLNANWALEPPARRFKDLPVLLIGAGLMHAIGVGAVVKAGPNANLSPGDYVTGFLGLQEYAVVPAQQVHKINLIPSTELIDFLGPLGVTGGLTRTSCTFPHPTQSAPKLTPAAPQGLFEVAKIKKGETIIVSTAAGSVGSLVVQFAKQAGARIVDIVYNYEKPSWKDQFDDQVGQADVYFENVGSDITDFMLTRLKTFGRVAVCGVISEYNVEEGQNIGIRNYIQIVLRRLRVQGFIVTDYASKFPEAYKEIGSWLESGSLKRKYHVVEGLENAGDSFNLLFTGENKGKLILKVAEPGGEKV